MSVSDAERIFCEAARRCGEPGTEDLVAAANQIANDMLRTANGSATLDLWAALLLMDACVEQRIGTVRFLADAVEDSDDFFAGALILGREGGWQELVDLADDTWSDCPTSDDDSCVQPNTICAAE